MQAVVTDTVAIVSRALGALTPEQELRPLFEDDEKWRRLHDEIEQYFTDDVVFGWVALGQRVERPGLAGLRAGWVDWFQPWMEYRMTVKEIRPAGDEVVLAFADQTGIPAEGAPVEMQGVALVKLRGERICAVDFYATPEDALAAAEVSG
jgi:ketosteroid isomerase-like protein